VDSLIVGITGPAQSGKDMVADIIANSLAGSGILVWKCRFADPLKDLVASLFDWDRHLLDEDPEFKARVDPFWDISPRKALQVIGTEMFREGPLRKEFGINMWVSHLRRRLEDSAHIPNQILLIPDCRFKDEFEMVHALGGLMVFADPRPRIVPQKDGHASEQDMWNYSKYGVIIDTGQEKLKTVKEAQYLAQRLQTYMEGGIKCLTYLNTGANNSNPK